MELKFEGISKGGYNGENRKSVRGERGVGERVYGGIKGIDRGIGVINGEVGDRVEWGFGSRGEIEREMEGMIWGEGDVVGFVVKELGLG